MPNEDLWKDQLTLVSGNILIWGIAVLKLWPIASSLQTTQHIHYLGTVGPRGEDLIFKGLTDAMGIAVSITALAVLHVLCRGIWFVFDEGPLKTAVHGMCTYTFNSSILLMVLLVLTIIASVPLAYIQVGTEVFLMSSLHRSHRLAIVIGTAVAVAPVLLLAYLSRKRLSVVAQRLAEVDIGWYFLLVIPAVAFGYLVMQGCYTIDLRTNTVLCDKDRDDIVVIYVTLGGATSSAADAKLKLLNSSGTLTRNLDLQDLSEGHYVAQVLSSTLPTGSYRVSLEYPQTSFDVFFPFIHSKAQKSAGFVVIRSSTRTSWEKGLCARICRDTHFS